MLESVRESGASGLVAPRRDREALKGPSPRDRGDGPERGGATATLKALLLRPELTAVVGTVMVFVFFAFTAGSAGFLTATGTRNYLGVAAEVGIIATPVTLLLIAGEFDLSVGSMMGTGGILFAYPVLYWNWGMLPSIGLAMLGACIVGLINGLFVTKTRVPSFIVTLAMMFILSGVTLAETNSLTGAVQLTGIEQHVRGDALYSLFGGQLLGLSASIWWWLGLSVLAAVLLDRMKVGNWIYATGGDREAAVKSGVPVNRVKLALFMATALGATLVGILTIFTADTADINAGTGKEFQAAVAAVIGGSLISGGYGSPIGTAFGALLFGMVNQGFFYTSLDDNWFSAFVGVMLLVAVLINRYTRRVSLKRGR